MPIAIREATRRDATMLTALARRTYVEAYGHEMDADEMARHLAAGLTAEKVAEMIGPTTFLVAEAAGGAVGFIQIGPVEAAGWADAEPLRLSASDRHLRRLYVAAEWQNGGIGRRLLAAALAHPTMAGAARLFLCVWCTNYAAQRFYRRYGFVESGATQPEHDPDGRLVGWNVVMVRPLPGEPLP